MGKSLSIIAITVQIRNINGYTNFQTKNNDNSDEYQLDLPASLEAFRPYFRPRKTPLLSPSEINRINQEIFSRQLLMDGAASSESGSSVGPNEFSNSDLNQSPRSRSSQVVSDPIGDIFEQAIAMPDSATITIFYARFMPQYTLSGSNMPDEQGIEYLRKTYKRLSHDKIMKYVINELIKVRPQLSEERGDRLFNFLQRIIFSAEITSHRQTGNHSDPNDALMYSLEAACNDMMRYNYEAIKHPDRYPNDHEYEKFLYNELFAMADEKKLFDRETDAGIIVFDDDMVKINNNWTGRTIADFEDYMKSLKNKMESYPFNQLSVEDAAAIKFHFIFKVLNDGQYEDLANFGTKSEEESIKSYVHGIFTEFHQFFPGVDVKAMASALQTNRALESLVPESIRGHYNHT